MSEEQFVVLNPTSEIRKVSKLSSPQRQDIDAYIQGAVYSWIRDRPNEWFSARDLFGGPNFEWEGTPLYALYDKHKQQGKANKLAIKAAGKDLGWLLKGVLDKDKRHFRSRPGFAAEYCWVGNEP